MLRSGESISFSGEGKDIKSKIDSVSAGGTVFAVQDIIGTLKLGKTYNLSCTQQDGVVTGACKVQKVEKVSEDEVAGQVIYELIVTGSLKKVQKRDYYRHDCYLPVTLKKMQENEKEKVQPEEGYILNISAHGAKVVSNAHFAEKTIITFETQLEKIEMILYALVLESKKNDPGTSVYSYTIRLKFAKITRRDEELIIKYIFDEYRKKKSKAKN